MGNVSLYRSVRCGFDPGKDNARVDKTASDAADAVRRIGIKLSALAQNGLTYGDNEYDLDRYRQVRALAAELLAVISGMPAAELAIELGRDVRLRDAEDRRARGDLRRARARAADAREDRRPVVAAGRLGRSRRNALGRGRPGRSWRKPATTARRSS